MYKMEVVKVRQNSGGSKQITIPKESDIQKGDYVKVIKLEKEEENGDRN